MLTPGITPGLSRMWHQERLQKAMPGSQGRAQWCACSCDWEVRMFLRISAKIWVSAPLCSCFAMQTRLPLTAQPEWETEIELLQALSVSQNQNQKTVPVPILQMLCMWHTHMLVPPKFLFPKLTHWIIPTGIWINIWQMDYIWMCKNSFAQTWWCTKLTIFKQHLNLGFFSVFIYLSMYCLSCLTSNVLLMVGTHLPKEKSTITASQLLLHRQFLFSGAWMAQENLFIDLRGVYW